jgi:hypothetical protein
MSTLINVLVFAVWCAAGVAVILLEWRAEKRRRLERDALRRWIRREYPDK